MMEKKPTKIFWQEPGSDRYCIDGKKGTAINEEQKEKLMQLLESDFDFITVRFVRVEQTKN